MCREQSGGTGLFVTEMVWCGRVIGATHAPMRMVSFGADEHPRQPPALRQRSGDRSARRSASSVDELGVEHIDLNFGCPAAKVTRKGGGAAVPVRSPTAAPTSSRSGGGGRRTTCRSRSSSARASTTTISPTSRPAASPSTKGGALRSRCTPAPPSSTTPGIADWDAIGELKAAVAGIPVLGNGDIWEAADAAAR